MFSSTHHMTIMFIRPLMFFWAFSIMGVLQLGLLQHSSKTFLPIQSSWSGETLYLASAPAPVVSPHYILVVFILFGQVVKEHALRHRLKHKSHVIRLEHSLPEKDGLHCKTTKGALHHTDHSDHTFLSRKDAIRPKFFGCWMNLWDQNKDIVACCWWNHLKSLSIADVHSTSQTNTKRIS